jgi:hypothetical protein
VPGFVGRPLLTSWRKGAGHEPHPFMPQSDSEIEKRLAALGNRSETMATLLEMVCGQGERQRRELQELRSAIASSRNQEQTGSVAPGEISPEMLAAS